MSLYLILRPPTDHRAAIPNAWIDESGGGSGHQQPAMNRMVTMTETNTVSAKPKTKTATSDLESAAETPKFELPKFELPKFEMPNFEIPKFEMPKFEVPAAFREIAEKGVTQAKDNWDKMKAATEETTGLIETSYASANKGAVDYGLKVLEAARANTNAAFDLAGELMAAKSVSEAIELSTAHARKQFEAMNEQTKELAALAQKVAADTSEPIKKGMSGAFKKVA
jgi:phasin